MARNKYPEETERKIIAAAAKLFMEKGYENTSINDIIRELGGLTKGAIYHHFKSKEEIYDAVLYQITASNDDAAVEIMARDDLNGREKLKAVLSNSLHYAMQEDYASIVPDYSKNPKLLYQMLLEIKNEISPLFILPIIEEGVRDGSIETDAPGELSELLAFILNFWMNPFLFHSSRQETIRKCQIFSKMLQTFHLDIVDEQILRQMSDLAEVAYEK